MKSNLLLSRIYLIQREYKELLGSLFPKIKNSFSPAALDEISLFWLRYSEEIQLYLKYEFSGENSYVFTATTHMSFDNKDYLPFLMMGDKHVVDDPLGKYAEVQNDISDDKYVDYLYGQIVKVVENNLKLLDNNNDAFLILPLRILNQSDDCRWIFSEGEKAFISLFDGINNMREYFLKCSTIDDVMQFARDDIGSLVMFSEEDDISLPFKERFSKAITQLQYIMGENNTDSEKFFRLVYGYIQQAIDIVYSCAIYGCIPSIANPVSLHYILLLTDGLKDIEYINVLRFRMLVAFSVHRFCDKNIVGTISFRDFFRRNKEYNFSEHLFRSLNAEGVNEKNFSGHMIVEIVIEHLEKFYDIISEMDDERKVFI